VALAHLLRAIRNPMLFAPNYHVQFLSRTGEQTLLGTVLNIRFHKAAQLAWPVLPAGYSAAPSLSL
jgi:hypothetical protein